MQRLDLDAGEPGTRTRLREVIAGFHGESDLELGPREQAEGDRWRHPDSGQPPPGTRGGDGDGLQFDGPPLDDHSVFGPERPAAVRVVEVGLRPEGRDQHTEGAHAQRTHPRGAE